MRLRPHRQNLVVWNQSAGRYHPPPITRRVRARRVRRWIRTGTLLTVVGLLPLARAVRARWRCLLPGVVLTVVGMMLRGSPAGMVLLPGLFFLLSAPLIPADSKADRVRHAELERELAAYSTPAQRCDLEAILDRYPDRVTLELRAILARQAITACHSGRQVT
jgi:hypothetical protein